MARCRWVKDKTVPGGKFWLPECWGGLYDPDGCYCDKPSTESLGERISELEEKLDKILKILTPPKA